MSKPEMVRSKPQLKIWNEGVCICSLKLSEVKHNGDMRAGTSVTAMWNSCFPHIQVLKLLNKITRCQTSVLWLLCSELCLIVYLVTSVAPPFHFINTVSDKIWVALMHFIHNHQLLFAKDMWINCFRLNCVILLPKQSDLFKPFSRPSILSGTYLRSHSQGSWPKNKTRLSKHASLVISDTDISQFQLLCGK